MANKEITNHDDLDDLINWGIYSPLDAPPDFTAITESSTLSDVTNKAATSFSTTGPVATGPRTINDCQQLPLFQGQTSYTSNQQSVPALRPMTMESYNQKAPYPSSVPALRPMSMESCNQNAQYPDHQNFAQQTTHNRLSNLQDHSNVVNRNVLPLSQTTNGYFPLNESPYTWSGVNRNASTCSSTTQAWAVKDYQNLSAYHDHHFSQQTSSNNPYTWSKVNRNVPTSSSTTQTWADKDYQNPSAYHDYHFFPQTSSINGQQSFSRTTKEFPNPSARQDHNFSRQMLYANEQLSFSNQPVNFQDHPSSYQTSYINGQPSVPATRLQTMDYGNQRTLPLNQRFYASQVSDNRSSSSQFDTNTGNNNVQSSWQAANLYPILTADFMPEIRSDQSLAPAKGADVMLQISPAQPHVSTKRKATPTFACETCGRVFVYKCSLMEHMKRHSDFLGYSCATCGLAFNDRSTLSKHIRTHTGERPYACDKCEARFTQSGNLRRHARKCY